LVTFHVNKIVSETVLPEMVPDTSEQQATFYAHLNVIIPIISGIICTIAASICVCIIIHRRYLR